MMAEVAVADAFAVVARCRTRGVAVGVVETDAGDLHFQLRNRVRVVVSYT